MNLPDSFPLPWQLAAQSKIRAGNDPEKPEPEDVLARYAAALMPLAAFAVQMREMIHPAFRPLFDRLVDRLRDAETDFGQERKSRITKS